MCSWVDLTKPFSLGKSGRRYMWSSCSLGDRAACVVVPASDLRIPMEPQLQVFPNVQQSVPASAVV